MISSVRNAYVVLVAVLLLIWAGVAAHGRQAEDSAVASASAAPALKLPPVPRVPSEKLGESWHPAPAGPGEVVYEGVGFRTRPPHPGAHPKVSRAEALVLTGMTGPGTGREGAVMELRELVTRDFDNETPKDAGLAWVATFPDAAVQMSGGKVRDPAPPPAVVDTSNSMTCPLTVIIDADTGKGAGTFQLCGLESYE